MADLVPADKFSQLPELYRQRARDISARVADIDRMLHPATALDVADELKRMGAQLEPQPGFDPRETASGYRDACADIPAWAVAEAANDYLCGRVESHSGQFIPHAPEFAKRARALLVPILSERSALRVEAEKLVERAADDARRHRIEMERADPSVRQRVAALKAAAFGDERQAITYQHTGLDAEAQAKIDALKKPREFVSKINETRLARPERRQE